MRMVLFILVFVTLFSGCAPRYIIKNQYIPPLDKASKICLKDCSQKRYRCKQRCMEDYSDCLSYAYEDAKKIQIESDKNYKDRYSTYMHKLNDYNFEILVWQNRYKSRYDDWVYFRNRCAKNRDKYACKREYDLRYIIKKLKEDKPIKPREPRYITFDEILAIQQQKCSKNCACETLYDSCFVSCGGEVIPHKICVENCD